MVRVGILGLQGGVREHALALEACGASVRVVKSPEDLRHLDGLVLPGAGMYYAGRKKTIGQYPRSAALITLLLGLLIDGLGDSKSADSYYAVAGGLYVIGSGIDIVMTPSAVADYNARHAAPIAVAPIAVPGGGGLALGGSF